jgi:hypothetical protein
MLIVCKHNILSEKESTENNVFVQDNIKIHIKEIGCEGVNWTHLAQDRGQS